MLVSVQWPIPASSPYPLGTALIPYWQHRLPCDVSPDMAFSTAPPACSFYFPGIGKSYEIRKPGKSGKSGKPVTVKAGVKLSMLMQGQRKVLVLDANSWAMDIAFRTQSVTGLHGAL